MSIKDLNADSSQASDSGPGLPLQNYARKPGAKRWWGRSKGSIAPVPWTLLFCLLIALVVRAWLAIHTQGFIDGDEALVGIQAEHILRGELPIYFYNQAYMGSLEAYLMAAIFAIVGPSVWALRAEPILLSLVVVWLTWKLAAALADTAQLPPHAKQWFMTIAALLAAVQPLYDTVLELRALGGYVEVFILMLLLLLSVLKLTNRRAAGASRGELAWRWAGIGFIVGLGSWINPLIIYGLLAAALWIAWDWVKIWRQTRTAMQFARSVGWPALASLPACVIGLAPALYWGAMNQWQNFTYLLQLGANTPLRPEVQAQYPTRLDILFGLTRFLTTCIGPRVVSGALPSENTALELLQTPTLILNGFCILATISLVALSFARPHPLLLRVRRLAALPVVFGSSVSFIFCVTRTAAIGLWACQYDLAGRYASPLMLVLPYFAATIFTVAVMLEAEVHKKEQEQQVNVEEFSTARSYSIATLNSHTQRAMLGLLVGFLILATYLQVVSYGLTDPGSTFQSPYCTKTPANNDAIIAYMQSKHIHYAWANNWIAYPIVFKTQSSIIVSDPLPIIRNIPMLDRIPAYTQAVRNADRPSFLVTVHHDDPYPELLDLLDAEKVTYDYARFPSQEGTDVLVITPLNQTVSPFGAGIFFNIFMCSRDG